MKNNRLKLPALLILVALFCSLGASCNQGSVVPPIPAATDIKIYQAFYQAESKYNSAYDLVVEFSKLTARTTNLLCAAHIQQGCDAGKKYKLFYDTTLVPASEKATAAYMSALNVYDSYRKGSASEATLQQQLDALQKMIDDLEGLFAQGKEIVQ